MYDPIEDFPERHADYCYGDLIGIVHPRGPLDDPAEAKNCLETIRDLSKHISAVLTKAREGEFDLDGDTIAVIRSLVDAIHIGAGYVLEWADTVPAPKVKEAANAPDPISIEKFRKTKMQDVGSTEMIHPGNEVAFEAVVHKLRYLENLTITGEQLWALNRALREQPEKIVQLIRENLLPFIATLPAADETIVGAEIGGETCLQCLTEKEKVTLKRDKDLGLTRDDADEFESSCSRCGKRL